MEVSNILVAIKLSLFRLHFNVAFFHSCAEAVHAGAYDLLAKRESDL
jgi:hypothetical protein